MLAEHVLAERPSAPAGRPPAPAARPPAARASARRPAAASRGSRGPCRTASGPAPQRPQRERQAQVLLLWEPAWRPSPAGRSLGCRASTHPRGSDSEHQFACPLTIIALPPLPTHWCAGRQRLLAGYLLPGLAGAWRPLRATARRRGPHGRRARATRSPSTTARTRRAPRRCSRSSPRAGPRDLLPRRRAGAAQPVACRARSSRPGHEIAHALRPPPQSAAPRRRAQVREDIARAEDAIATATGRAPLLYRPALRRAQRRGAHDRLARRAAGGRCCGATGAGTGRRAPRRSRSRAGDRGRRARARCCCCTTPTTTRRRGPGGAPSRRCPRVLETMRERALEPVVPDGRVAVALLGTRHRSGRLTSEACRAIVQIDPSAPLRPSPQTLRGSRMPQSAAAGGSRC